MDHIEIIIGIVGYVGFTLLKTIINNIDIPLADEKQSTEEFEENQDFDRLKHLMKKEKEKQKKKEINNSYQDKSLLKKDHEIPSENLKKKISTMSSKSYRKTKKSPLRRIDKYSLAKRSIIFQTLIERKFIL